MDQLSFKSATGYLLDHCDRVTIGYYTGDTECKLTQCLKIVGARGPLWHKLLPVSDIDEVVQRRNVILHVIDNDRQRQYALQVAEGGARWSRIVAIEFGQELAIVYDCSSQFSTHVGIFLSRTRVQVIMIVSSHNCQTNVDVLSIDVLSMSSIVLISTCQQD